MHPNNKYCFDMSKTETRMTPAPAAHSPAETVSGKSPPNPDSVPAAACAPVDPGDAMDTSDFVGSGSGTDLSRDSNDEEEEHEGTEELENEDHASLLSKLEKRLATTETIALRNQDNMSSMGRNQLAVVSRVLRVERESVRG